MRKDIVIPMLRTLASGRTLSTFDTMSVTFGEATAAGLIGPDGEGYPDVTDKGRAYLATADKAREASNAKRRASDRAMRGVAESIGVRRVRGALGGSYYE